MPIKLVLMPALLKVVTATGHPDINTAKSQEQKVELHDVAKRR